MAKSGISRRSLLSSSALLGSYLALEGCNSVNAATITQQVPWTPDSADPPQTIAPGSYQFLTTEEAVFIDAATARLIPADELGPGAKEAGAAVFIDRQLAGPFGDAAAWYMQGPWGDGTDSQGFQSRLTPAQSYRAAIKAIDDHCRNAFGGKTFSQLSPEDQDSVLGGLEKGSLELGSIKSKAFFEMFLQNTVESFFADPIYGGNRDMAGWKLIGFPGAHYDYREFVSKHNQKLDIQPVGIKGRPGWKPA
jgi:gluconate 2-dehydrogenase gamma chain